jgi:uncharacterized membrane protein YjfL (UPF0719 family)
MLVQKQVSNLMNNMMIVSVERPLWHNVNPVSMMEWGVMRRVMLFWDFFPYYIMGQNLKNQINTKNNAMNSAVVAQNWEVRYNYFHTPNMIVE